MRRKARKEEIYQAAARVFRAKGYHAARIQDVADELDMHKGSLYYYISSKEDLLRGLVEGPLQSVVEEAHAILATRHPAPQKLARVIEMHLRHFQQHKDFFGIFLREDLDFLNAKAESDIRALVKQYDALWDALLQEGIDQGAFRADLDKRIVRKAIIGMCNGTFTWFKPDGRYPLQEIARLFADFALHGVSTPVRQAVPAPVVEREA